MMLEYFRYQQTPAGRVVNDNLPNKSSDLLGVMSFTLGQFEIKAKGEQPSVGDTLLLPVKGSKQLSLQLKVVGVEHLITPIGAWSAKCKGPAQANFNVRVADITCDNCLEVTSLEFIDFSGDVQADALLAMNKQGWQADSHEQVCPICCNKK